MVNIGGATVKDQIFGLPDRVSSSFVDDTYSNGLVGLGFSSINTFTPGPQKTFFDNIASDLEEPVFTARLRSDGVGEYEFGKVDHAKYTGNLVNISVDSSSGFWQFEAGYFAVGSDALQKVTQVPRAIADTGTSLMLVSPEVVTAYYKKVQNAAYSSGVSGWVYPCSAKLPSLTVALGDKYQATIPGSLVNFAEVGKNTTTGETGKLGFFPLPFFLSLSLSLSLFFSFSPLVSPFSSSKSTPQLTPLGTTQTNLLPFTSMLWWHPIQPGLQPPNLRRRLSQGSLRGL